MDITVGAGTTLHMTLHEEVLNMDVAEIQTALNPWVAHSGVSEAHLSNMSLATWTQ